MVEGQENKKSLISKDTMTYKAMSLLPSINYYQKYHSLLKKTQHWDRNQLEKYQLQQLSKLLEYSYKNVPYYTRMFDEQGIKPKDIQDFKDLTKIPFLTKEIIRNNLKDMVAKGYPHHKLEYVTTGGSSGVPLGFYFERGISRSIEWGFIKTLFERVGYRFTDRCLLMKGAVTNLDDPNRFHKKTLFGKWLMLSSYHMTEENLPDYIEIIKKYRPKYIQGFPSSVSILARYMKKNELKPFPSLKTIILASENMYPGQRELIESVFQCRVFSFYGHSERVILAGECEQSNLYHVFPEYGILELVTENGKQIVKNDEIGIMVGTGLTNYGMPLIRYKTDDIAMYANGKCSCGRDYQLIKNVEGRWLQEFLVAKNGRLISITAINMHSDIFDNVEQFQFYQDTEGAAVFNIIKKDTYTDKDTAIIKSELLKKLGSDFRLETRFVDSIERTKRGKHMFLVQKLPINFDYIGLDK